MSAPTQDKPTIVKDERTGDEEILINPPPKGMTREEADKLLSMDIREEFYLLAQELERFHGIFAQLWEMGLPRLTFDLPTAAVSFDKKGRNVEFLFNPIFWRDTDRYTKCFIICHEVLHVLLSHGLRSIDCPMPDLANKALDVVVNHMLTSKFGFDRASIDVGKHPEDDERVPEDKRGEPIELCWIDTVFPGFDDQIQRDKPFEYYYNMLEKNTKFIEGKCMIKKPGKSKGKGKGGSGGAGGSGEGSEYQEMTGSVLDRHDKLEDFDDDQTKEEIADEVEDRLNPEELEDILDTLNNSEEGGAAQKASESDDEDGDDASPSSPGGKKAGSLAGRLLYRANVHQKVRPKKKWETVIKKWSRKYKDDERDLEQWARRRRRYAALPDELLLPSDMDDEHKSETKIDVWFFQDTSGSCYNFRDRFFEAAKSLPKERFNIHMFCFDTKVYPTTLESGKLYGFGGTNFSMLETYIQDAIRKGEIKKYPEAVFVITDGWGNNIQPQQPEKWYWFLSENYKRCIPDKCHTFDLREFE